MLRDALDRRDPAAVRSAVGVARCTGVKPVPGTAGDDPKVAVGQRGRLDETGQRLHQVHVDQLAGPAVQVAVVERHHDGERGGLCRDAVGQEERRQGRRPVGLTRHVGEPAHGLGQRAESRPVARRPTAAVAADVEHDELRVRPVHRLVVEAPPGQHAGAVVHDEHVADVEQTMEELLSRGVAQVERDALLVASDTLPEQPDPVLLETPGPQRVTCARLLDLDDLGPELPQRGRHHGPRGQRGGVHHAQALERSGRVRHRARSRDARGRDAPGGSSSCSDRGRRPGAGVRAPPAGRHLRRPPANAWRR